MGLYIYDKLGYIYIYYNYIYVLYIYHIITVQWIIIILLTENYSSPLRNYTGRPSHWG